MKPIVFISHVHSEANVAIWLKESISELLLGAIEFFVSSDRSSIIGGDKWLSKIEGNLKTSSVSLVLCSKQSVHRPWINFEAGGAWMAGKRVVPVCHAGMSPRELPEPLRSLQAYELSNPGDLQDLVGLLAREAGLRVPSFDPKKLADSLPPVETEEKECEVFEPIALSGRKEKVGTGWLVPIPDKRDLTENHERIVPFNKKLGIPKTIKHALPSSVDLRPWCPDVKNQGTLNSATAHAAVSMIEYLERRGGRGASVDLSRLFVYKQTRNIMHRKGDSGAWIRSTLKAIRLFGIPPSEDWPYTDKSPDFDTEPPAHVYAMGFSYQGIVYFCHDPVHMDFPQEFVLAKVKAFLAAGIPSVFGFHIFPSFDGAKTGRFPFPCPGEEHKWKHAVLSVGYDDRLIIKNTKCNIETRGALLIQNSWGKDWGEEGYGWIPFEYVLKRQALDFWSILSFEWVDTAQFHL